MDLTLVLEDEIAVRLIRMEVGFFDSFQEIKEKIEKITGIPTHRQTLLFNGQVLRNEDIIFNTDISEASRVHLLDADFGNHAAPPNSNHHDEIMDMQISSGDELEELMWWNPDAPPPDKNENEEMPSSIVEDRVAVVDSGRASSAGTADTDDGHIERVPPRNPEFTPSPSPPPPPPLHETEITPGGSVSDERNPKE